MPAARPLLALLTVAAATAADAPAVVQLGGPRQVRATVAAGAGDYIVEVRMLPVRSFDKATNDSLNRDKARLYALQALARHLTGQKSGEIRVRQARVAAEAPGDAAYSLTLAVPRDGVQVLAAGIAPAPAAEAGVGPAPQRVAFVSEFFTRKGDLIRTAEFAAAALRDDIAALPAGDDRDGAVADLEERIVAVFATLRRETGADPLLLGVEADEVRRAAGAGEASVMAALRRVAASPAKVADEAAAPPPAVAKRFRDIDVKPPFDRVLFADPLLMEVAGAKIVRLPDGGRMLLGVASTVLQDGSARDRLRAETVCRVKAQAALVGQRDGVRVYQLTRLRDESTVRQLDGREGGGSTEELLQVTQAKLRGIVRGMGVVGRWKSSDGETFTLALGAVLDGAGDPVLPAE